MSLESPLHLHFRFMATRLMDIRTRLPAEALARDPELVVSEGVDVSLSSLPYATPKVIVTQRQGVRDEAAWLQSTARLIRAGWVSVLEYDDHPLLTAAVLGQPLTETMWRHFSHFHAVQTSTPRLAKLFSAWNPNIALFPNAVFDLPPLALRTGAPRVFYGAVTRGPIAVEVARSLAPVALAHPEVKFVVIGDQAVFEAIPSANKVFYDYLSFEGYNRLMAQCDISLAPLGDEEGLDCKSDAKFLDGARNGAVTVGSPTVYAETIVDGETGFIARELGDWSAIVGRLVEDAPLRARVATQAWSYVQKYRLFEYQAGVRRDWYKSLWAHRHTLSAQMVERTPELRPLLGLQPL